MALRYIHSPMGRRVGNTIQLGLLVGLRAVGKA